MKTNEELKTETIDTAICELVVKLHKINALLQFKLTMLERMLVQEGEL